MDTYHTIWFITFMIGVIPLAVLFEGSKYTNVLLWIQGIGLFGLITNTILHHIIGLY